MFTLGHALALFLEVLLNQSKRIPATWYVEVVKIKMAKPF
jgi:hypothetical protein